MAKVDEGIDSRRADWRFDAQVAGSFDEHVRRSVPLYDEVQVQVADLSDWFVGRGSVVYDVGCASGSTIALLSSRHIGKGVAWVGIDEAEPMLEAARKKLIGVQNVRLVCRSIPSPREQLIVDASFVTALYTLQFVMPRDRPAFVGEIYDGLVPGGAFVLVEKILGTHPRTDGIFVELYHSFKRGSGFTHEQVVEKALSLRGVLVPDTAEEQEVRLKAAGFRTVDRFFGWYNWAGWLAVK
jgi:tRNA (cmo5U34)-methyltransferase